MSQEREEPRRLVLKGGGTEQTDRGQRESSRQTRPRGHPPVRTGGDRGDCWRAKEGGRRTRRTRTARVRQGEAAVPQNKAFRGQRGGGREGRSAQGQSQWRRRRLGTQSLNPNGRGLPVPHTGTAGHSTDTPSQTAGWQEGNTTAWPYVAGGLRT